MQLRKTVSVLLAIIMSFNIGACSCASKKTTNNNVRLTMWGAEEDQQMYRRMADRFIEANKGEANITIEIGVQSEQSIKEVILKDVSATADIYSFASDQLRELKEAGALMAIPESMNLSDVRMRNLTSSIEAATIAGKLYAYPRTADNGYFLFYNKEYLTEEDVASWEKMLEVAATKNKKVTMEMNSGWYTYGFFKAVGLDVGLDGKNTTCNWNSKTNSVPGVKVAQKLLDICKHKGFIATEDAEFVTGIKEGTIIAGVNGTWNAKKAEEAWGTNYGATKLPTFNIDGNDYQMYSVAGFKYIGVNPHCENAGWALKFADFLTNEENQIVSFKERGYGPSNIKAGESEEIKSNIAVSAFTKQQKWAALQEMGTNYWNPTESFGQILQDGNPGNKDLQQLLDELVAGVTAPVLE